MQIYNQIKGKYIQAWSYSNPEEIYVEKYINREKLINYYNPKLWTIRKEWVEKFIQLNEAYDYACGLHPFWKELNIEIKGMYDKYVPEYNKFNYNDYINSKTLMMFDFLEHVYDPFLLLQTIPQKQLILSLPIVQIPYFYNLNQIKEWQHYREDEHYLYSNEEGIIEILNNTGWNIIDMGYYEKEIRKDILCINCLRK